MTTVQDALDEYLMTIGGSATGAASGRTYESRTLTPASPGPGCPTPGPRTWTPRWRRPAPPLTALGAS